MSIRHMKLSGPADSSPACVQHYAANDQKLKRYVPIIRDSLVYPVILDAQRRVLSLPPVINGAHSAVRARAKAALNMACLADLQDVLAGQRCAFQSPLRLSQC